MQSKWNRAMTPPPPTDPPEHSGLRPLSPYGEGYCRWCCFVVGLDRNGLLVRHFRGGSGDELLGPRSCPGTGTRPPKITPYTSRKARFRVKAQKATCHLCRREVSLMADGRMTFHAPVAFRVAPACPGGYQVPGS